MSTASASKKPLITRQTAVVLALLWAFGVLVWICAGMGTDPLDTFQYITEIDLPKDQVKVLLSQDDHTPIPPGDGETNIQLEVSASEITRLAQGTPPWSASIWQKGPAPQEISGSCLLLRESEDNPLLSSKILFATRARGPQGMPWHNGDVLILDVARRRIWLVCWDA